MNRIFKLGALAALLVSSAATAQTTTTYTGTIKDLAQNVVTSGQVNFTLAPPTDSTLPGVGRFTSTTVTCNINADGTLSGFVGGVVSGPCNVTMNTALSPGGTSYQICIQPQYATPGSCFYDYATTASKDISTVAPTLTTGPLNYGGVPGPVGAQGASAITGMTGDGAGNAQLTGTFTADAVVAGSANITGTLTASAVVAGSTNGERIAGTTVNPTIQAAVNAGGPVLVPGAYTGGEMYGPANAITQAGAPPYTNYGTAPVTDLRALNHDVSLAQLINLPALDDEMEGGDTARAGVCAQLGVCRVAVVGNSIHETINGVAPDDGYVDALFAALRRKFPSVTFTTVNLSIGGATVENFNDASYTCGTGANTFFRIAPGTWYQQQSVASEFISGPPYTQWPAGCTNGNSWKSHLATFNPDIVVLGFVENEYGVGSGAFAADLLTAITYVHGLASAPAVVLTTDEPPNPAWNALLGNPDPAVFEALNETVRGMAVRYNLMLADADRYYNVLTYGVDPGRRHFQVEHAWGTLSGISYPSGWSVEPGFTGTLPALTGSGVATTITFASGNAQMIQRARNAEDVEASAAFNNLTDASVPSVWYRMDGAQHGYKVQVLRATVAGTSVYSFTLYYSEGTGGTQLTLASGSCSQASAASLGLLVFAKGTKHDVWCWTPGSNNFTHVINTWDYQKNSAGAVALGVQNFSGGESIANEYVFYGNPLQYFTPLASIPTMLGTPAPPTAYSGSGDFDTNYLSFGGDGVHHPNALGFDTYYLASFRPVLDHLARVMTPPVIATTSAPGAVQPDNSTITESAGIISAHIPTLYDSGGGTSTAWHIEEGAATIGAGGTVDYTFQRAFTSHYACGTSAYPGGTLITESNASDSVVTFGGTAGSFVWFNCVGY